MWSWCLRCSCKGITQLCLLWGTEHSGGLQLFSAAQAWVHNLVHSTPRPVAGVLEVGSGILFERAAGYGWV